MALNESVVTVGLMCGCGHAFHGRKMCGFPKLVGKKWIHCKCKRRSPVDAIADAVRSLPCGDGMYCTCEPGVHERMRDNTSWTGEALLHGCGKPMPVCDREGCAPRTYTEDEMTSLMAEAHGAGQVDALKNLVDYLGVRLRRMGENPLPPDMSAFAWPNCKQWCGLPMREALAIAQSRGIDGGAVRNFKSLQRPGYVTQMFCSNECRNRFARSVHAFLDDGTGNCNDCGNGVAHLGHYGESR